MNDEPTEVPTLEHNFAGRMKALVRRLKVELHVLWLAFRHPRAPWYAKAILLLVLAYAMSPVDLIPDIIPVLGMLDDLVVISLGLWLAVRLIPDDVMTECRAKAMEADREDWIKVLWQKFKDF